jgi:hypothetical protein
VPFLCQLIRKPMSIVLLLSGDLCRVKWLTSARWENLLEIVLQAGNISWCLLHRVKGPKLMIAKCVLPALLMVGVCATEGYSDDAIPQLSPDNLQQLLATIKPQRGESPWREIPWLTNVTEARRQAIALDRPLVIFTAADGSPLSRT